MGVEPVLSRGHNRERRKGSPDLFVLTESLMVGIACTIGVIVLSIQGSCLQLGHLVVVCNPSALSCSQRHDVGFQQKRHSFTIGLALFVMTSIVFVVSMQVGTAHGCASNDSLDDAFWGPFS